MSADILIMSKKNNDKQKELSQQLLSIKGRKPTPPSDLNEKHEARFKKL